MATATRRRRDRPRPSLLLQLDASASLLEVGLELVGLFPLDALLDCLGGLVHERLGLLETQARGSADNLDHLDLLLAGARQQDVERRLLLGRLGAVGASGAGGRGRGGDRGGRDAELLLERLDALREL